MSYPARSLRLRRLVSLVLLVTVPSVLAAPPQAFAQARPAAGAEGDLLERGRALFDDQKYEESIQVLSAALVRPNSPKAVRVEVHRLLAFNYITLGRRDEAESAIRGLLVLEPDYALPRSESPRFRDVFTAVREKWEAEGRPGLVTQPVELARVSLVHTPRAETKRGDLLPIHVGLDDPGDRTRRVIVLYRAGPRGDFDEVDAEIAKGAARALVPGPAVQPPFVDYFVMALDEAGATIAQRGDASAPLRVVVPQGGRGWVLPVVIGGSLVAVGAVFGGLALAGVFKSPPPPAPGPTNRDATVSVSIRE